MLCKLVYIKYFDSLILFGLANLQKKGDMKI